MIFERKEAMADSVSTGAFGNSGNRQETMVRVRMIDNFMTGRIKKWKTE